MSDIVFDGVKLASQLIGAFFVARFSVSWALDRYKSEKIWERQLAAYADLVAAIGEMLKITIERDEVEEGLYTVSKEEREKQNAEFAAARLTFLNVLALAGLLLPKTTMCILNPLKREFDHGGDYETYHDHLNGLGSALRATLEALIIEGRDILHVDHGG